MRQPPSSPWADHETPFCLLSHRPTRELPYMMWRPQQHSPETFRKYKMWRPQGEPD
jgi:hypothetical protein